MYDGSVKHKNDKVLQIRCEVSRLYIINIGILHLTATFNRFIHVFTVQ